MRNLLKGSKLWGVVMSLFVVGSLSAQDVPYTPFNFEGNPKWTDNAFWAGFGFEAMSTVTWKIDGSEVIDSTLYFNLFAKEVGNYGPPGRFDHVGYVRESEDRKVYFIPMLLLLALSNWLNGSFSDVENTFNCLYNLPIWFLFVKQI